MQDEPAQDAARDKHTRYLRPDDITYAHVFRCNVGRQLCGRENTIEGFAFYRVEYRRLRYYPEQLLSQRIDKGNAQPLERGFGKIPAFFTCLQYRSAGCAFG